jgi:TPR repeat protein
MFFLYKGGKTSMTSKIFIYVLLFLTLTTNVSAAAVQLDEKFLKSNTGNSSVYLPVERLIEVIKNIKLNNGTHPKILGWQRKGNVYSFTFVTSTKTVLKFEHLINQGGDWSSISAIEDGNPINPLSLIMQIISMPRDKTKFDIVDEKNKANRQKQESIFKSAEKKKQDERDAIIKEARDEEDLKNLTESIERAVKAPDLQFTEDDNEKLYYYDINALAFNILLNQASMEGADAQSMYELGKIYKRFRHTNFGDDRLFVKWIFGAAMLHNHPTALYEAAIMLRDGESSVGLIRNQDLSDELMEKSASLGYAKAQTKMALYYIKNDNVKLYQEWLLKAVKQNEPTSIYLLGSDYSKGKNGFKENLKEGIRLLKYCANLEKNTKFYNYDSEEYETNSNLTRMANDELSRILGR